MEKNKKSGGALKFLEGAAVGLALGIAGAVFLSSKTGQKLQKDVKDNLADFYKYISPKLKKMGKMAKKDYEEFMKQAVVQYGKARKMSEGATEELMDKVKESWKHLSKHL